MVSERDRVDVRGTVWFVVLAYLPAWLLSAPLWLTGEGLSWKWAPVSLTLMMFTPAVAALVVNKWISPAPQPQRALGLTNPGGIRKWWHYALLGFAGPLLAMLLALVVGYLLGVYEADWTGFSGLVEQTGTTVVGEQDQASPTTLALTHIAQVFLLGWVHSLPALGEELGWRGYLTKALLPLGQPGAFLTSGVLWGLWHAPILLLGYNYPTVPVVVSFLMMGCFCVLVGTLLSWLRLASDSVWPAAIAHGFLNSAGALALIFSQAGHPVDNAVVGLLGWSGWIVLALLILVLIMIGKLPVRFPEVKQGISKGVERRSRKA
ncbi:CPBP family intramembrane glutamic endopeptidase [Saccharopolyspora mangrovi]|uniref:CPBP family intramembrane glutamic endopeptidase n=1 Tax=Saccharopolyspora mangrovi TaxID=3082379 RepID=A0ABU6AA26_9PSEU|nr:CPBP family intramembrane glutamic endopeptidase [Saccharopolyspora sp. S2-29]MEB3368249.1 CPBP family intramembrane glutamic endopeptidase [Saccharopolyspora sp. S2-29]